MIGLDLVVEAAEGAVLEKEEAAVWKTRWRAAAAYSKRGPPPCCSEPVQANATQQIQGTNPPPLVGLDVLRPEMDAGRLK